MEDQYKTRDQLLDELTTLRHQLAVVATEGDQSDPDDLSRLASFPEQNPDPTLEIDDSGCITYMNPAAEARFPELTEVGLDHPFFKDLKTVLEQFRSGGDQSHVREHRVGAYVYDQKVTRVPGSRLIRIYAHDITERKHTEEALHQSEKKYRSIIENLAGEFSFFSQDLEENTTFIGLSGADMMGYTPEEFAQLDHAVLVPDTPLNQEASRYRERIYRGERQPPYQFEMRHKDGTLHRYEVIRTPVLDEQQQVIGTEGMVRDITASHRAAEELQQANEAAHQAQNQLIDQLEEKLQTAEQMRKIQQQLITQEKMASLGRLVAGIAHEINNPSGALNSAIDVIGRCAAKIAASIEAASSLESLRGGRQLETAQVLLHDTTQNAAIANERIAHLVRSLKNFAHLDEAEYQVVDIREGLESALTLLAPQLEGRIEIVKDLAPLNPIYCAPAQLNQVFMHLLQNAQQAIEGPGRIILKVHQQEDSIYIYIGDTGSGIPPGQLEKIFDINLNDGQTRVKAGFGLFIDFNIVKEHDGDIKIESEVGKGTEVTVRLPVKTVE